MDAYSPQFIEEMKQKLLEHKAKLEEDLAGLKAHTELGSDVDAQVEEVQVDEVNRDLIARITVDIHKIDKALARIEAGTYGFDDQGKMIGEGRLRAMPWAENAI